MTTLQTIGVALVIVGIIGMGIGTYFKIRIDLTDR
jgi:hypothetical protein